MIRNSRLIPALCAAVCLSLCGCGSASESETAEVTTAATAVVTETEPEATETTAPVTEPPDTRSYMEKYGSLLVESVPDEILIPRDGVEYPQFEKYYYYSQTAERETGVNVLLPANYSADRKYPVMYVLHGSGDTEDWMARDEVGLSVMLNNLVADGLAKEMIIVSPYIYCSKDMPYCTGLDEQNFRNFDNFNTDLMTDLKPFIEANFPASPEREDNAITGFSLGGRESLYIGFTHPDAFGFLGSICPASGVVEGTGFPCTMTLDQFHFTDQSPELFLLSAAEQDHAVGLIPYDYHQILEDNGTEHIWHVMTDSGHEMRSAVSHLYSFMRMCFLESDQSGDTVS